MWDRILVCIGRRGIPPVGGGEKLKAERPASRAIIAFYGPRPPLGGFTQEMGFLFTGVEEQGVDACGRSRKAGEEYPSGRRLTVPEGGSRFLRSQLRRIGLGHPPGRDPLRTL